MASVFDRLFSAAGLQRKVPPRDTAGVTGVVTFGGWIATDERRPEVVGQEKWRTYRDLLTNVSIVAAGVRYFLNLVCQPAWKINGVDDSPEAVEVVELIEDAMGGMRRPWARVVRRAALYRFNGFGIQEWTAKKAEDGSTLIHDIMSRPAHTIEQWDLDETGDVRGVVQRAPQDGRMIYLPREKIIYMVDDSLLDTPDGLGLLRHVVEPADRLTKYQTLEHSGFITDLRGIPIARVPYRDLAGQTKRGELSDADRRAREGVVTEYVRNHVRSIHSGIALDSEPYFDGGPNKSPSGTPKWGIELLQGGSTSIEHAGVAISRLTDEIARILGVEHLLLGADGTGSLALSKTKSHDFAVTVDSSLTEIAQAMQQDFIEVVCDLNGVPEELRPKATTESLQMRDAEAVSKVLAEMATAGAVLTPDDPAINEVRDMAGLSHAPEQSMEDLLDSTLTDTGIPPIDEALPTDQQAQAAIDGGAPPPALPALPPPAAPSTIRKTWPGWRRGRGARKVRT